VPIIIHLIQKQRLKPQQTRHLAVFGSRRSGNAFAPVPRDMLQLVAAVVTVGLFVVLMSGW